MSLESDVYVKDTSNYLQKLIFTYNIANNIITTYN
ncbi:hypothetical protein J2W91_002572 [Paenibacillus amylolyticus]|uniref:Uncharacterized protein n=1 Tax=Paenibacillus amylolyticus TaxID=1451 RepID=A0AAP5H0S7_PAEAM|nr:hypothetical protein [Paenibacillus amylolyticus]